MAEIWSRIYQPVNEKEEEIILFYKLQSFGRKGYDGE